MGLCITLIGCTLMGNGYFTIGLIVAICGAVLSGVSIGGGTISLRA